MEQAIKELMRGKLNPLEAAAKLDQEIGGITRVIWNPGARQYKVHNHTKMVTIPARGANNRVYKKLEEFAALAYLQAQDNGNWKAGEVHIGYDFSTKHHNFRERALALKEKYSTN